MPKPTDLEQGTLDLLILPTIVREPLHGWGIAKRIERRIRSTLKDGAVIEVVFIRIELLTHCWSPPVVTEYVGTRRSSTQIVLEAGVNNTHWIASLIEHEGA